MVVKTSWVHPHPELYEVYPPSDAPMVEGSQQYDWLTLIKAGLEHLFRKREDVVVAGDMMWYPVEGNSRICISPDVFVVFGRPKGERQSYIQHVEGGVAPQVVFEIVSPGNRAAELAKKLRFYDEYGVEEYYTYDPAVHELRVWTREEGGLRERRPDGNWRSPLLGVRFEWTPGEPMRLFRPNGREITDYSDVTDRLESTEEERDEAIEASALSEQARLRAEQVAAAAELALRREERKRIEAERKQAEEERQRIEAEQVAAEAIAREQAKDAELARVLAELEALKQRSAPRTSGVQGEGGQT